MLTHWFKTKKRPSTWRRNPFNWLTFLKLSLNCIWVLLNNFFLQKANYLLCFSENLTGIPVELPTSWPVTRLSFAWFGSFRLTDSTAYLLAPVPCGWLGWGSYLTLIMFLQLISYRCQTKTEKLKLAADHLGQYLPRSLRLQNILILPKRFDNKIVFFERDENYYQRKKKCSFDRSTRCR